MLWPTGSWSRNRRLRRTLRRPSPLSRTRDRRDENRPSCARPRLWRGSTAYRLAARRRAARRRACRHRPRWTRWRTRRRRVRPAPRRAASRARLGAGGSGSWRMLLLVGCAGVYHNPAAPCDQTRCRSPKASASGICITARAVLCSKPAGRFSKSSIERSCKTPDGKIYHI